MDSMLDANGHTTKAAPYLITIAERVREAVAVIDLNGAVGFVNRAWAAMHGCKNTSGLLGRQLAVFHTEQQMKTDVNCFIEEVKQRGQLAGPLDHVRADGTIFPTHTLMVLFRDRAGNDQAIICFAADITEYEHIREQLRQYRSRENQWLTTQKQLLNAAEKQPQQELAEQKRTQEHLKRQINELTVANEQLRGQIAESHAGLAAKDIRKSPLIAESQPDDREILVHVFSENIALQKPVFAELAAQKNTT